MLIQAAINGTRTRTEHPAIPVTPEQQAQQAGAAVLAGAGAGSSAESNAALVTAAARIVARAVPPGSPELSAP